MPKFLADSNYETEMEELGRKKRRRVAKRLESSSDEEIPIRKQAKPNIPAPPPVSSVNKSKAGRKGQGMSKDEHKKKEKEQLMLRLKKAREAAAAKMKAPSSPWKVTPTKSVDLQKTSEVSSFHLISLGFSNKKLSNLTNGLSDCRTKPSRRLLRNLLTTLVLEITFISILWI